MNIVDGWVTVDLSGADVTGSSQSDTVTPSALANVLDGGAGGATLRKPVTGLVAAKAVLRLLFPPLS